MPNEYISKDQDFSTRTSSTYRNLMLVTPIAFLALVAIGYSILYPDKVHHVARFSSIREGLSQMDLFSVVLWLLGGIGISIGFIAFLKSYYQGRQIVVALKFDDQSKQLTVKTKQIDGIVRTRTHKYADLLLEYKDLGDGMTPPVYKTLTLVKGGQNGGTCIYRSFHLG